MAHGTRIIAYSQPKGVWLEGVIQDTSKPGTLMQIDAGQTLINGWPQWVHLNLASAGNPAMIAVLLEDSTQGGVMSTAYVAGTNCFIYVPLPGERLNVMAGVASGTSNYFTIGQALMADSGVGVLIPATGSPNSEPFISLELASMEVPDYLLFCIRA